MQEIGFHEYLDDLMRERNFNNNSLAHYLTDKGFPIDRAQIYNYRNCFSVPEFERAKQIVYLLSCKISDNELSTMLKISKSEKEENDYNYGLYFSTSVRIPYLSLTKNTNMTPEKVKYILKNRIKEVSDIIGGRGGINSYIAALIRLDIDYNILNKYHKGEKKNG